MGRVKKTKYQKFKNPKTEYHLIQKLSGTYYRCGKEHHSSEECPATKNKCNTCDRRNHYAKMCRTKKNDNKQREYSKWSSHVQTVRLSDIRSINFSQTPRAEIKCTTRNSNVPRQRFPTLDLQLVYAALTSSRISS